METDFEDALDFAGTGKYQIFHCALMLATLSTALLEIICYSFILPAAACDLDVPENLRGLITSIPNIGIILTAPLWGRAADFYGRKPILLLSSAATGFFGFIAAFMPNLIGFSVCKFLGSLFLSGPSSLSYAYAGEMVPRKRRDLAILMINGFLTLSSALTPVLAWGILSADWHFELGSLSLRPWRLLTAVYALPLIVTAVWMTQAKESPKFLMTKDKQDEALNVLKHIYSKNTGMPVETYHVKSLKKSAEEIDREIEEDEEERLAPKPKSQSAMALLRPPHLKWFALTAFLMFGLYTLLNGLFLFATDTINKVLRESSEEKGTLCILLNQPENTTTTSTCNDSISNDTFIIMVGTTLTYGLIVVLASISPVSKKTLLLAMFVTTGTACLLSGLLTNRVVAGVAMSALQLTALGIGPLTAYAVQLFPTSIRGTAVGAVMMFGRVGSCTGANVAGYLLAGACTATFYGFAALVFRRWHRHGAQTPKSKELFILNHRGSHTIARMSTSYTSKRVCAALCFLLPKDDITSSTQQMDSVNNNR